MYKVFYNQRTVFLSDKYNNFSDTKFEIHHKYLNPKSLKKILNIFNNNIDIEHLYIYDKDIEKLFSAFSKNFKIIEAAGGLVKTPNDEILVIKRRGLWDLPKGKIEIGESTKEGALREVEEECGIRDLKLIKHITTTYHTYLLNDKAILKRTYWYEMHHSGKTNLSPQTEEEITEVKWLTQEKTNIITENTFPTIIDVLNKGK
ncbi:MAG: NUDIX domain-containing protein [Bacteroidota bacterium]|nr:NUDIX domain-containing protein [Bacteroidota bacterium]